MVRSKDPFWNYIEDRTDGSMKCKFCPHTFANKTSISRIKWHLSGEEGHNVAICHGVPKEVQEAAWKAANKKQKITASSVNVNDCGISQAIAGNDEVSMTGMRAQEDRVSKGALESRLRTEPADRALEQSNAVLGNLAGGAGRVQAGIHGVLEQGAGEERINRVRRRTEPVEEDVENSRRSVQVGAGARSSESLKYNKTIGAPLPTSSTKPVGQAFEENTKVICSLLMDGDVSTIGIYGMGEVGKSTILQHVHNKFLQKPDICDHVWWVTVSQNFSINRLQDLIAEYLDIDLSRKNDELHRAVKLSEELRKKQK